MARAVNNATTPTGEPMFSAFLHARGRQLGIPVAGTFELTPRCNFNCKMCYIHSADCNRYEKDEHSAQEWIKLGEKARDEGMLFLLLTGGEPLMRKDFPEIYKGLNGLGLLISVNTNASMINDEIIELFKEFTPHRLNVSLYGANEETYKNLCGNAQFENVITNLRKLKEAGISIRINCSITPDNCNDAEEIYRLTDGLGLNIKSTTYMYPPLRNGIENTGKNAARFSPFDAAYYRVKLDMLRSSKQKFLECANAIEKGLSVTENECIDITDEGEGVKCRAGLSSFWVSWDGYMSPCGMIPDTDFNVFQKDFRECWQGIRSKALAIRLPGQCSGCNCRNICPVCPAVCICETGAYNEKPGYICEYSKHLAELTIKEAERLRGEKNDN